MDRSARGRPDAVGAEASSEPRDRAERTKLCWELPDAEAVAAALDCLPQGVVLVEGNARVVFANSYAMAILHDAQALEIRDSKLVALDFGKTLELWRMVAEALEGTRPSQVGPDVALALSRPQPLRPLSVSVSRLRNRDGDATAARPLALVLVGDPERDCDMAEEALVRLYGLTPAESRLALALLEGQGLDHAAEQLAIGRNTARTHLKRIFEKTRTHRQAELVRLMLRGPMVHYHHREQNSQA